MSTHYIKSWRPFFRAIKAGDKTHDLRVNDRDFKVGDTIVLQEYDHIAGEYTGSECRVEVTYITSERFPCAFSSAVLAKNYCILSLKLLPVITSEMFAPGTITADKLEPLVFA